MTTPPSNRALDAIQALERAPSVLKLKEVFRNAAVDFGYESFLCSAPPRPQEKRADPILFEEWPRAWKNRYTQRRYYLRDPMLLELYRTADPYTWGDVLSRRKYPSADRAIVHDASAWRMREGFVVPLYGVGGQVHAVTMAGQSPRTDREARAELHLVSIYAYARARHLANCGGSSGPTLSARECEALRWVAAGKSDWEIGEILGISESAAHKRVENAKRKIGVATRIQAVVEAMRSGQLQL